MGRRRDDEHRIFVRGPFSGMLSGMMLGIILRHFILIGVVAWVLLLTLVSGPSQTKILIYTVDCQHYFAGGQYMCYLFCGL